MTRLLGRVAIAAVCSGVAVTQPLVAQLTAGQTVRARYRCATSIPCNTAPLTLVRFGTDSLVLADPQDGRQLAIARAAVLRVERRGERHPIVPGMFVGTFVGGGLGAVAAAAFVKEGDGRFEDDPNRNALKYGVVVASAAVGMIAGGIIGSRLTLEGWVPVRIVPVTLGRGNALRPGVTLGVDWRF